MADQGRGLAGSALPEVTRLGVQCKKCGADDWYIRKGNYRRCAPCARGWHQQHPAASMFYRAKSRAKRDGVEFLLTIDDVAAAWPQDNRCPIFGTEFAKQAGSGGGAQSPTLDRIVPSLGYVPGNIAVISNRANGIKSDATPEEVLAVGRWMQQVNPLGNR